MEFLFDGFAGSKKGSKTTSTPTAWASYKVSNMAGTKSMTEQIQPRLLTVAQAAVYLGMSPWSVRNLLIWSGKVPVIRLGETGKRHLLDKRDLDALIDRQKEWREG